MEVQKRLADYLAGLESLENFANWLSRESSSVRYNDSDLFDLVASVLNRVEAYFDGNIDRHELRKGLAPLSARQELKREMSFVLVYTLSHDPSLIPSQSSPLEVGQFQAAFV